MIKYDYFTETALYVSSIAKSTTCLTSLNAIFNDIPIDATSSNSLWGKPF